MNYTPLRYPGGKAIMTPFIEELIKVNSMNNVVYAEPYAGGAGAAINLLLSDKVEAIKINDACLGIYSFWYYLLTEYKHFLKLFKKTEITLEQWQKQRIIFKKASIPSLELGFATFFLSRTNRSGILSAGPMGGQDPIEQDSAKFKINCRFNKENLYKRFEQIIEKKDKITVTNFDALTFLKKIKNKNIFVYLDPPYYTKGKALYMNYYEHKNHVELSQFLRKTKNFKWMLSYDDTDVIKKLYSDFLIYKFDLLYTAQKIKKGSEILIYSKDLKLPRQMVIERKSEDISILPI